MIVILFPLRIENPFPKKISMGKLTELKPGIFLTLGGTGESAAKNIEKLLKENKEITELIEIGGAALVSSGQVGTLYEIATFYAIDGTEISSIPTTTSCPTAALTSCEEIYRGKELPQFENVKRPLLYTMESLALLKLCRNRGLPFRSLRLATDSGKGDLLKTFRSEIEKGRKAISTAILEIVPILKHR